MTDAVALCVVRVGGDDGEHRLWHYIYVCSIGSRLIIENRLMELRRLCCFRGCSQHHIQQISYKKITKLKPSGNEVYCTHSIILLVKNMLYSKLHCQKGSNSKIYTYKIRCEAAKHIDRANHHTPLQLGHRFRTNREKLAACQGPLP